jgi:hypothetical protein
LRHNNIIQKLLTLVMMLIFVFSITPKKYLHDAVADHQDYYSFGLATEPSVSKTGINCACDDLVVSASFLETSITGITEQPIAHGSHLVSTYFILLPSSSATKDSRGPPSMAVNC